MNDYPEHEKLRSVKDESQAIGEFVEWLSNGRETPLHFGVCRGERFTPIQVTTNALLAEYFGIDQRKLEAEKKAMLEALRRGR